MAKSLLEQLPKIVAEGKRQAAQILEQLESRTKLTLQTREFVLPNKSSSGLDLASLDAEFDPESLGAAPNRLIYGDNLLAMAALLSGDDRTPTMRNAVDLIYIDPPFDSKADYRTQITLPGADLEQRPNVMEQFAYSDTWADGTASYLEMLTPRLFLMRELLSETGSIVVHLDWHVGSYVRVLLDEIFGKENFRNEIVWSYGGRGAKAVSGQLPRNHDTLFVYGKNPSAFYNRVFERRSIPIGNAPGFYRDDDGRWFKTSPRGDYTDASIARLRAENRVYETRSGGIRIKYFVDSDDEFIYENALQGDVWADIPDAMHMSRSERLDYGTQKPEKLIERLIDMACPVDGLVADFFVGSGTTAAVAERMGRRWIATDLGKPAVMISRKRLIDQHAKPFLQQEIGDYQIEQARSSFGSGFRVGDLAQTILSIYGALPLPAEENVNGSLGRTDGDRTLVFADSPSRLTSLTTLKRAQNWREAKLGGFDKVVVLGWNFPTGIGQEIERLGDPRLEVRVIPPHLIDQLKKSGKDRLTDSVRFATLQYLDAHIAARFPSPESEEFTVELDNYVLLSPDAISLKPEDRSKVLEVMNREPLALIEYWAVDPDYDGEVFRSSWQDYRGNTANDGDALRVVTKATVTAPRHDGPRQICVRAVDVFGFESEVILDIPEPAL
ncbi:adenine-specific DNA-methyltransferase [Compostimonas suwonensis]|uniref:Adenine-specific DNA-methyltransferase n=2 Tax=Compostimonas suwonensis TaxID=1048394 RepID=A0A2M9BWN1_9MICO|nr:adenine-specific DNA-methyltransferase [Compostimonas suwonensis]